MKHNYYKIAWQVAAVLFFSVMTINGLPATQYKIAAHVTGLDMRFIEWCNDGDNMIKEPACNGATVEVNRD